MRKGDGMKTCSLCGGKLDANMRCIFCGLDNTKNDDMYKHLVNQNDCGEGPLTHVHTESGSRRTKQTSKKSSIATVIGVIAIIATLASSVFEIVENLAIEDYEYSYQEEEIDYEPYEYVTYELPESGMTYSITLEPGIYRVGTHIPEGTYVAEATQGSYGMIEIQDSRNGIYLYENIGLDDDQIVAKDLRLYQNGLFIVSTGIVVELTSENVQSTELLTAQSALTASYVLSGEAMAGEDFLAGVYNVVYNAGNGEDEYGEVKYCVPMEDYEYEYSIFFDGSIGAETYHNVVLTEGTTIELEDLEKVTLVPCAEIPTISFEEYYKWFY